PTTWPLAATARRPPARTPPPSRGTPPPTRTPCPSRATASRSRGSGDGQLGRVRRLPGDEPRLLPSAPRRRDTRGRSQEGLRGLPGPSGVPRLRRHDRPDPRPERPAPRGRAPPA